MVHEYLYTHTVRHQKPPDGSWCLHAR